MSNINALANYIPDAWRAWQHLGEIRSLQERATPHIQALMALMPEAQQVYAAVFPEAAAWRQQRRTAGATSAPPPPVQPPKMSLSVKELQELLNHYGAAIEVDGEYGPATKKAVENYQKRNGLSVDGWAGLATIGHLCRAIGAEHAMSMAAAQPGSISATAVAEGGART